MTDQHTEQTKCPVCGIKSVTVGLPKWLVKNVTQYFVDFNTLGADGDGYMRIRLPQEVSMVDGDGNYCEGDVMGLENGFMWARAMSGIPEFMVLAGIGLIMLGVAVVVFNG